MNRYVIEGLIRDLHAGKTIMLTAPTMHCSLHAFRIMVDALQDDAKVSKVRLAHGLEGIDMSNGGQLRIMAANGKSRRVDADVVVLISRDGMRFQQLKDVFEYVSIVRAEAIQA